MAAFRTATKLLRFSPDELARITAHARACGCTPALFIRETALGATCRLRPHTDHDTALDQAPGKSLLQNTLARALHELEAAGLVQLRRVLTAPQAALAFQAQKAVRDMVLATSSTAKTLQASIR